MIRSFADKATETLFCEGETRGLSRNICGRAIRKLDMIDSAVDVRDLRVPPGNRLHALQGNRNGFYSISINEQCRIVFRFVNENAFDVEICDYH